jgi:hypothetical protein
MTERGLGDILEESSARCLLPWRFREVLAEPIKSAKSLIDLAHPIRFERTTFAFGEQSGSRVVELVPERAQRFGGRRPLGVSKRQRECLEEPRQETRAPVPANLQSDWHETWPAWDASFRRQFHEQARSFFLSTLCTLRGRCAPLSSDTPSAKLRGSDGVRPGEEAKRRDRAHERARPARQGGHPQEERSDGTECPRRAKHNLVRVRDRRRMAEPLGSVHESPARDSADALPLIAVTFNLKRWAS